MGSQGLESFQTPIPPQFTSRVAIALEVPSEGPKILLETNRSGKSPAQSWLKK
jgi:hypothetical protein